MRYLLKAFCFLCLNIHVEAHKLDFSLPWKDNCKPCILSAEIIINNLKHEFNAVTQAIIIGKQLQLELDPNLNDQQVIDIKQKITEQIAASKSPYAYQDIVVNLQHKHPICPIALQHVLNKFKQAQKSLVAIKAIKHEIHLVTQADLPDAQLQDLLAKLVVELQASGIQVE